MWDVTPEYLVQSSRYWSGTDVDYEWLCSIASVYIDSEPYATPELFDNYLENYHFNS